MAHPPVEQYTDLQELTQQPMDVLGQLEAVAADRFTTEYGMEAPSGDELMARGLGANMSDSRTAHIISLALRMNAPHDADPQLLANTKLLADAYMEKSPRSLEEQKEIENHGVDLPKLTFEQMMLIRDSLVGMWAADEEDGANYEGGFLQAAAQEVLVDSLFPGEFEADQVLQTTQNVTRGQAGQPAAELSIAPPEVDVIPLDDPYPSTSKVARLYSHSGTSLLRFITVGNQLAGIFVTEPTPGTHRAGLQQQPQVELVPFRIDGDEPKPLFRKALPLKWGAQVLLEPMTGVHDGAAIGLSEDLNAVLVNPGVSGEVRVENPQQEHAVLVGADRS